MVSNWSSDPRDSRGGASGKGHQEFVVTDWTEDLTLDCNTDDADLGDVLGTLIKQLIEKGILTGTVASA